MEKRYEKARVLECNISSYALKMKWNLHESSNAFGTSREYSERPIHGIVGVEDAQTIASFRDQISTIDMLHIQDGGFSLASLCWSC